jgi:hypothetical protein
VDRRYDERVPIEDGPVVEERDERLIVKDHVGGDVTVDDLVENALCRGVEISFVGIWLKSPLAPLLPRRFSLPPLLEQRRLCLTQFRRPPRPGACLR